MALSLAPVQQDFITLQGGLDLVSPAMQIPPGALIDCLNFEPDINGGYRRMYGIQRYDGRTRPSEALYYTMAVTLTGSVVAGNTITGNTSGATAVVLQVNSTTELIVTKLVGTFVQETIKVGGVSKGTCYPAVIGGATTPYLDAIYAAMAADNYRADIQAVPGTGSILGVWYYNGTRYAFRNNAGGTACDMYKSTASGWSKITFGREIQFTAGTSQISEGDTLTGNTSGATGVVKRVLLRTGTWGGTGVGTVVFDSVTGAFQNGENLRVGATPSATANGVDTEIALQPGGRFVFRNYNFSGTTSTFRMYFADGVNFLSEFDGTRLVPIRTGITPDAPKYLACWKNMMVVAIASSVQVSGIGSPFSWSALTGAAELALGETCTGILEQIGNATSGAIVISTASKTFVLYGNTSSDFKLVVQSPDAGSQPYTLQNIAYAYYLDTKGVVNLQTTLNYGNFEQSTITRKIQPIIDRKRGLAVASCIVRRTNQYRLFFSDGSGIILYAMQTDQGIANVATYFDYGKTFNTVESYVDSSGVERILAGGTDGYVYELDEGTSVDGSAYFAYIMLSYAQSKSPRNRKRYRRSVVQATCLGIAEVTVGYELSYGDTMKALEGSQVSALMTGGGGFWDSFVWDSFVWDAPYVTEYTIDMPGQGTNIGLILYGNSAIDKPYTLHGIITHYMMGRQER